MNPAKQLHAAGQSLWLDSISRRMLASGTLARYLEDLAVTGLTSNPTILGHAMAASADYDGSLRRQLSAGLRRPEDLVYASALEDLTAAADLFRPIWEAIGGADGYVSVEVPHLLVKIPGTAPSPAAMESAVAEGIGIDVTLPSSDSHYLQTADAYIRALERLLRFSREG